MVSSHLTIIIRYFSGPLLRNVHWGGKSRQKGQFLLNHVALCFNASCCVVCPNRKIIAFRKKGTFSGAKQAWVGGQIWGLEGQLRTRIGFYQKCDLTFGTNKYCYYLIMNYVHISKINWFYIKILISFYYILL